MLSNFDDSSACRRRRGWRCRRPRHRASAHTADPAAGDRPTAPRGCGNRNTARRSRARRRAAAPSPIDRPRGADHGTTETSPCGRNWHARRTSAGAPMRLQRVLLVVGRRRTELLARRHPHPAGRASRPAAAHRGMRQVEAAARLQHRPAARHAHGPAGIRSPRSRRLRRRSIRLRISRAMNAAPMMAKYQLRRLSFHCAIASRCTALSGLRVFQRRRDRGRAGRKFSSHGDKSERREHRQQQRRRKTARTGIADTTSRRLNAKCRPRQPCSHPGAIRPSCQPCDPVAQRLATTRV